MKVLALTPYSSLGPSSRYRVYQLVLPLSHQGIDVHVSPFLHDDAYRRRFLHQAGRLRQIVDGGLCWMKRLWTVAVTARRVDVVMVSRQVAPVFAKPLERLLRSSAQKIVFDMDDSVFLHRDINGLLKGAEAVIVGNKFLRDYARQAVDGDRVYVVPTLVDVNAYEVRKPCVRQRPVVGWIGTEATYRTYLERLLPRIVKVCAEHGGTFRVISTEAIRDPVVAAGAKFQAWAPSCEYSALAQLSVGLMPLASDLYAQGKCAFKLIQYGAAGLPSVASAVGANVEVIVEGVTGHLADTDDEFLRVLSAVLRDEGHRNELGKAARKRVETLYSLDVGARSIATILQSVAEDRN